MKIKTDRKITGTLTLLAVCLVIGTFSATSVYAEDAGAYIPPQVDGASKVTGIEELDQETLEKLQKRVTLNFKDEELQNVVRLIAADTGLNVVLSNKEVKGKVTLALEDVPVGTALSSILQIHNLTIVREKGGIVRVLPLNKIMTQKVEVDTIHMSVNWVPAVKVAKAIEPFLSEEGRITAYEDTNTIILSDTPLIVDELREIITSIDVPEKQVTIEARLCEMFINAARNTGISWDLFTPSEDTLPIQTLGTAAGNTLGTIGGFTGGTRVGDITQLILNDDGSLGKNVVSDVPFAADAFEVNTQQSLNPAALWSFSKEISIGGTDYNFSAAVDLLEQRRLAKTLANPKVVTLNNVPAKINIVRRIPYIDTTIGSGGSQTISFRYEDVGIELTVTPNITNNGYIRMNIQPIQKILIEQQGTNRPTVDLRESNTNVIVKDEDTAVILGLRQQDFTESTDAVPWIHRVPAIGWLFKGKSHNTNKNDLVAFVTPRIVKQPGITEEEQFRYDEIDDKWDLPDYFFDDVRWDDSEK